MLKRCFSRRHIWICERRMMLCRYIPCRHVMTLSRCESHRGQRYFTLLSSRTVWRLLMSWQRISGLAACYIGSPQWLWDCCSYCQACCLYFSLFFSLLMLMLLCCCGRPWVPFLLLLVEYHASMQVQWDSDETGVKETSTDEKDASVECRVIDEKDVVDTESEMLKWFMSRD